MCQWVQGEDFTYNKLLIPQDMGSYIYIKCQRELTYCYPEVKSFCYLCMSFQTLVFIDPQGEIHSLH